MIAFYNEIDDFACGWLSNLMDAGLITPGYISNESIEDIVPSELVGYDRVHFFAGIGGWDYALNLAGWGNRPVWTGSCPCQPFSTAGKGAGTADERHLWPAFFHLIEQCRPVWVFGEQVASSDALAWLDLVCSDLEGTGYAARALDMCAAGFGAPHIRQRLYWVAESNERQRGSRRPRRLDGSWPHGEFAGRSDPCRMGDGPQQGLEECIGHTGIPRVASGTVSGQAVERAGFHVGGVAYLQHAEGERFGRDGGESLRVDEPGLPAERSGTIGLVGVDQPCQYERSSSGKQSVRILGNESIHGNGAGPTNGAWRDADWLFCRDGRWRPVEPSTFCLAHGVPNRMGKLRGYGNAIVIPEAAEFIKAVMYEI